MLHIVALPLHRRISVYGPFVQDIISNIISVSQAFCSEQHVANYSLVKLLKRIKMLKLH